MAGVEGDYEAYRVAVDAWDKEGIRMDSAPLLRKDQLDVPILLIIFNRPDLTQRVFNIIRRVRPFQLFVKADGARAGHPAEAELCEKARKIATVVDWKCDVRTSFNNENAGCRMTVSSGVSWFFDNVNVGIILEDDCLPSESFLKPFEPPL